MNGGNESPSPVVPDVATGHAHQALPRAQATPAIWHERAFAAAELFCCGLFVSGNTVQDHLKSSSPRPPPAPGVHCSPEPSAPDHVGSRAHRWPGPFLAHAGGLALPFAEVVSRLASLASERPAIMRAR
jgi:hypothetical protein